LYIVKYTSPASATSNVSYGEAPSISQSTSTIHVCSKLIISVRNKNMYINRWHSQKFQLRGASSPFPSSSSLPLSSLPSFSFLFTFPSSPLSSPLPLLSLPSKVRDTKIQLGSVGECCELPQQDLGWSCSQNQIWCTLGVKDEM